MEQKGISLTNWSYPQPRTGFTGFIDRLVGPGATKAELIIQFSFALCAGLAMLTYALIAKLPWTGWQIAVASYLAFDICGGIATNATSSAKRWWHREEPRHLKNHAIFITAHFYMPLLITLAFFPRDWTFFVVTYGYLLIAAAIIVTSPLYLRRPVAFILYTGAIIMNGFFIEPVHGLEWFIPFFYLKLLMSHLVREEPYRPAWEQKSNDG
ncbi:MAG: hypothetical protein ACE5OR_00565 [bacterium]